MQLHFGRAGERRRRFEQIAHGHAFPTRVAHQTGIEPVADAHERRFLFDRIDRLDVLELERDRLLDQPVHFQVPEANVHLRIDHVLGHAIKLIVRRDRLDDASFVLRAVITKRGGAIKFAAERDSAAGDEHTESAQNERAPSDGRTEFRSLTCRSCRA